MRIRLFAACLLLVGSSFQANAQSSGLRDCGLVPSVDNDLEARLLAFSSPSDKTANVTIGLYVCRLVGKPTPNRICETVLADALSDFVAAQWVDAWTITVETKSLQAAGKQLNLAIVDRAERPAVVARIEPAKALTADGTARIGERLAIGAETVCREIQAPVMTR